MKAVHILWLFHFLLGDWERGDGCLATNRALSPPPNADTMYQCIYIVGGGGDRYG